MKKILVIWELVPENTMLYLLTPTDETDRGGILKAHGEIIGDSKTEDAAGWLAVRLAGETPIFDMEDVAKAITLDEPVDVVVSGFLI